MEKKEMYIYVEEHANSDPFLGKQSNPDPDLILHHNSNPRVGWYITKFASMKMKGLFFILTTLMLNNVRVG
jgi:hypothetical protein